MPSIRPRSLLSRTLTLAAFSCFGMSAMTTVSGAEITLQNGSTLEGTIVDETDSAVVIALAVGSGSASMTIQRDQIASIDTSKGAEARTVEAKPAAVATKKEIEKTESGWPITPYIVIDISGVIGEQITADGINKVMNWAGSNNVLHLVFNIDVKPGGDVDEARKIFQLLQRRHGRYVIHALCRNAVDGALAIGLNADAVYFRPGGKLGGTGNMIKADNDDAAGELARMAFAAGQAAQKRGNDPAIVRAMIDPSETIALGIEKDGDEQFLVVGSDPTDLGDHTVIASADASSTLLITAEQGAQLGIATVNNAAGIGEHLDLPQWEEADTDVGTRFIAQEAQKKQARAAREEKQFEDRVVRLERKRQENKALLENYIDQAKTFNPKDGKYATKKSYRSNYGGRVRVVGKGNKSYRRYNNNNNNYYGGSYDTQKFTKDSRNEWRNRSQMTLQYIQRALNATSSAIRLERDAERLGLEAMYEPGYLENLKTDLNAHYQMVAAEAGRDGR